MTPEIRRLLVKWRKEADDIEADGDICCALTRRHDADALEAALLALLVDLPPTEEAEQLHTGDDDRLDLLCGALTFLEELEGEDAPTGDQLEESLAAAIESCERLHVALVETVNRERAASADLPPLPDDVSALVAEFEALYASFSDAVLHDLFRHAQQERTAALTRELRRRGLLPD